MLVSSIATLATLATLTSTILALPTSKRQDDHAHASLCTDANQGGECINFGLRAIPNHCWDFKNGGGIDLTSWNDNLSSIKPEETGAVWTLYENFGCSGAQIQISQEVDDLSQQPWNFNDRASSISVLFR